MKKASDALEILDAISSAGMRSLPTPQLFRFAALCAHWADLGQNELGKRAQQKAIAANPSDRTRGER